MKGLPYWPFLCQTRILKIILEKGRKQGNEMIIQLPQ